MGASQQILSSSGRTYATWNNSDKDASISLSNGNLTATGSAAGYKSVRSTIGKSSGKWYWEVKVDFFGAGDMFFGFGNSSATLGNFSGFDANGYGCELNGGNKYTNNSSGVYLSASGVLNSVYGMCLDMDSGICRVILIGTIDGGTMYSGLTGTIFPMWSGSGVGGTIATANFGNTAFSGTPPAGFTPGLFI